VSRFLALIAIAAPGFCQVQVDVTTNQATYLAGEPVFAVADVKNIGTEPLGYSGCYYGQILTVLDGPKKQRANLYGCFAGGFGGGSGGGIYDGPPMNPGQTRSCWYLLKGYNLRPGEYTLHATGKAAVFWKSGPPGSPGHAMTDPIEGQSFEASMKLIVQDATEAELKQRYAPWVADAEGWDMERRWRAREAIAETAPPFLEKMLLGFADQPETAHLAVEGLGQIQTPESRGDLVALFDKSADLRLRADIVEKLAGIGTTAETAFFSGLLAGRSTALDDRIRVFAALGLGRIGGKDAVKDLENAPPSPNPDVREAVAIALGNTKSPAAIPVLIGIYADQAGVVQNAVCLALVTLTHYQWCGGAGFANETQARWLGWWHVHAPQLLLYDADQCPASAASLPSVR
jgi:hypothetical protein